MSRLRAFWGALRAAVGPDELALGFALTLVSAGAWMVYAPAALLLPGLILVWLALPSRAPFVRSTPPAHPPGSTPGAKGSR